MSNEVKRCAACRREKPVSEMKTCMHNQMHRYVCDMKCMNDFYNPTKKPSVADLAEKVAALEAECAKLRGPEETVTSARGDKLFTFMSKDPCRYQLCEVTYAAPVRVLIAERDALAAELAAIRAAGGEQVEVVEWRCEATKSGIKPQRRIVETWAEAESFALHYEERGCKVTTTAMVEKAQHQRIVAAMAAELEKITKQRDAILQQARIWAMEAKTQRSTVLEVGEILGGVPDWGPIAAGVEAMRAELEAARKQEPVAWTWRGTLDRLAHPLIDMPDGVAVFKHRSPGATIPLYALPPLAGQVGGQEWVPVSERLPEAKKDGRMVLAFVCGIATTKATATVRELVQFAKEDGEACAVTHWMPLPSAPALLATPSMEVKS